MSVTGIVQDERNHLVGRGINFPDRQFVRSTHKPSIQLLMSGTVENGRDLTFLALSDVSKPTAIG